MQKKVLMLCASHNDLGMIRALRKLGYYIIVTGNLPGLIGEKYADEYIQADYSDKEFILSIAKKNKIQAICQCCNDYGVYTAAYIAETLGLPGYDSYQTTITLHNKDRFKEFAKQHGILTPKACAYTNREEALNGIQMIEYPAIIKPVDASAGNGIKKVDHEQQARAAIKYAFEKSRAGRIVVEHYVSGTQHGFCTFLHHQKVVAVSSNNEYSIRNPYRVEIDTFPADNYEQVKDILIAQIEKIASVLQLKDGIFHLQYIMEGNQPQIIEVMRRVLGNMYSVPANMLNGFDWDYWEVRAKCGLSCDGFPQKTNQEGYYAYKTILAEKNGIIQRIDPVEKYQKYIVDQCMIKGPGDRIENNYVQPIGFLFFMFSSAEEMKEILINEYENSMVIMDNSDDNVSE